MLNQNYNTSYVNLIYKKILSKKLVVYKTVIFKIIPLKTYGKNTKFNLTLTEGKRYIFIFVRTRYLLASS